MRHDIALTGYWILGITIGLLLLAAMFWWIRLAWRAGGEIGNSIKQASTPIPSPQEIAWSLQNEWGRPPTIQEVQAVHQMLYDEHNAALINSGIGLGAVYLLWRA